MSLQQLLPEGAQPGIGSSDESGVWAERRAAKRRAVGEPGHINAAFLDVPLPCLVCDISTAGARLYVHDSAENLVGSRVELPSQFMLTTFSGKAEVDCAVVWRNQGLVGVCFLSPLRPSAKKKG